MSGGRSFLGVVSRSPSFAALLGARALSLLGDGIGQLALVIYVQRLRGTGTAVGLLLLVASLPRLLSPLAGTVADRVDRRRLLAWGEMAQGALVVVVLMWLPPLLALVPLVLAKAMVVVVAEPAGQSAVPALVDDDDLTSANAILGSLRQVGEVLGPLVGGVIVAVTGVRAALAVDALTFLVSVPLVMRLPPLGVDDGDDVAHRLVADVSAGIRATLSHPVARALFVSFFFTGIAAADDVALPFLARHLGGGERAIGALYAAVGAGLVAGYIALGAARAVRSFPFLVVGAGLAALGNGLTGMAPVLLLAVTFQVVRGLGIAFFETTLQTLLQRTVPPALLGRVFANVYGAVNVGACLGLLFGGPLLDATSARLVLVACGIVGLAPMALAVFLLPQTTYARGSPSPPDVLVRRRRASGRGKKPPPQP